MILPHITSLLQRDDLACNFLHILLCWAVPMQCEGAQAKTFLCSEEGNKDRSTKHEGFCMESSASLNKTILQGSHLLIWICGWQQQNLLPTSSTLQIYPGGPSASLICISSREVQSTVSILCPSDKSVKYSANANV